MGIILDKAQSDEKSNIWPYILGSACFSSFVSGLLVSPIIMIFMLVGNVEKHIEKHVQMHHLRNTCITSTTTNRVLRKVDNHYRCFDGDTIVQLDYRLYDLL